MLVRKLRIKYVINIRLHFFGNLYIFVSDQRTQVKTYQNEFLKYQIHEKPCDNKYRNFYSRNFDLMANALLLKHTKSQFCSTNGDV